MFVGSLQRLVGTARALPGERRPARPLKLVLADAALDGAQVDADLLRTRLGRFLVELSQRLEPALQGALQRAAVAWDAFDEIAVLDDALRGDARELAAVAAALEREPAAARRAIGAEVRLALSAALGLTELCERRLAMLVRLRLQSGDPSLLPDQRPFLDVAAALAEAARGWT